MSAWMTSRSCGSFWTSSTKTVWRPGDPATRSLKRSGLAASSRRVAGSSRSMRRASGGGRGTDPAPPQTAAPRLRPLWNSSADRGGHPRFRLSFSSHPEAGDHRFCHRCRERDRKGFLCAHLYGPGSGSGTSTEPTAAGSVAPLAGWNTNPPTARLVFCSTTPANACALLVVGCVNDPVTPPSVVANTSFNPAAPGVPVTLNPFAGAYEDSAFSGAAFFS
jgi:hypothetical protein